MQEEAIMSENGPSDERLEAIYDQHIAHHLQQTHYRLTARWLVLGSSCSPEHALYCFAFQEEAIMSENPSAAIDRPASLSQHASCNTCIVHHLHSYHICRRRPS
jgi:hypothetical protein